MTVKNAVLILNLMIACKTRVKKELCEPGILNAKSDLSADIYLLLQTVSQIDIDNLEILRKQLVPECRHPKKMHDICKGQKYCKACNADL
ncbi:hypothetical protein [Candidatus Nitrosotenuis cloacae]|uniref:hypothetical protein n=1 Tax=Candidatus Nitrosotenuis cloacae TaxID=1603555 RepID=UPI00227E43A4|nr:hypothetical protein [Candidatus Nitrosotenuis cloacae]